VDIGQRENDLSGEIEIGNNIRNGDVEGRRGIEEIGG
jgi:hypothetical protein